MCHKRTIYTLIGFDLLIGAIGLILQRGGVAEFLFWFAISLLIVLVVLLFFSEQIFQSWKKFAQIFIPISIILVILAPEHANKGFDGIGYGLDKEQTTWWLSGIFLVMSLVVIVYNNLKLKKQK